MAETQSTAGMPANSNVRLRAYLDRFQAFTEALSKLTEGMPEKKAREVVAFFTEMHTEHTELIKATAALYSWSLTWAHQLMSAQIEVIDANRIAMEARSSFLDLLAGELAAKANDFQGGEAEQLSALRAAAFAVLGSIAGASTSLATASKALTPLRETGDVFLEAQKALDEAIGETSLWPAPVKRGE